MNTDERRVNRGSVGLVAFCLLILAAVVFFDQHKTAANAQPVAVIATDELVVAPWGAYDELLTSSYDGMSPEAKKLFIESGFFPAMYEGAVRDMRVINGLTESSDPGLRALEEFMIEVLRYCTSDTVRDCSSQADATVKAFDAYGGPGAWMVQHSKGSKAEAQLNYWAAGLEKKLYRFALSYDRAKAVESALSESQSMWIRPTSIVTELVAGLAEDHILPAGMTYNKDLMDVVPIDFQTAPEKGAW